MPRRVVEIEVEVPSKQRHRLTGGGLDNPESSEGGPPSSGGAMRRQPDRASRRQSPYAGNRSPHHGAPPGLPTTGLSSVLNGVALDSSTTRMKQRVFRRFPQAPPSQQRQQPPPETASELITRLTDGGVTITRESIRIRAARVQRDLESKRILVNRQSDVDATSIGHTSVDKFREAAIADFLRRPPAALPPRPSTSPPIRAPARTTLLYLPRRASTASASGRLPALSHAPPPIPRAARGGYLVRKAKLKPDFEGLSSP